MATGERPFFLQMYFVPTLDISLFPDDMYYYDYSDKLVGGDLQFTNAHAGTTCGCGVSFNLAGFPVIDNSKYAKGEMTKAWGLGHTL